MEESSNESDIQVFEESPAQSTGFSNPGELQLGIIVGFSDDSWPLIELDAFSEAVPAMTTVSLDQSHVGRQVATMFATNGNQPVVIGLIKSQLDQILEASVGFRENLQDDVIADDESILASENNVLVDGEKVVIEGKNEVVLKCGESSITLTKSGKILIRGKYLLNRSSGVNRIMGGSVQVN